MTFLAIVGAATAVVGTLLWFTGWAEQRVIADPDVTEAKTR
jgi:hypothetical protein